MRVVLKVHEMDPDMEVLCDSIIACGLYCYHMDAKVRDGQLEIISADTRDASESVRIAVHEGMSVVLSNDGCRHRLRAVHGNGCRRVIWLYLLRPDAPLPCAVDARSVVVNWEHHARHMVAMWLNKYELTAAVECASVMRDIVEFVIGSKEHIQAAIDFYKQCRGGLSC